MFQDWLLKSSKGLIVPKVHEFHKFTGSIVQGNLNYGTCELLNYWNFSNLSCSFLQPDIHASIKQAKSNVTISVK
jgi:hypothetical protein